MCTCVCACEQVFGSYSCRGALPSVYTGRQTATSFTQSRNQKISAFRQLAFVKNAAYGPIENQHITYPSRIRSDSISIAGHPFQARPSKDLARLLNRKPSTSQGPKRVSKETRRCSQALFRGSLFRPSTTMSRRAKGPWQSLRSIRLNMVKERYIRPSLSL